MAHDNIIKLPRASTAAPIGRRLIPSRLRDARKAKRMTQTDLARMCGITRQAISTYEAGDKKPEPETFALIVEHLEQPMSFFTMESLPAFGEQRTKFFRKFGQDTARKNDACEVLGDWFVQTAKYFDDYVNYPKVDILEAAPSEPTERYTESEIENLASACRQHWGLGLGPISNVLSLLESKGVAICRFEMPGEEINAFSFWNGDRPFIFMASDKKSCARARFDLAHELGHLIMHRWVEEEDLQDSKTLKLIESEADRFAGAFLMPQRSFPSEIYTLRLDAFVELKKRWKTSIQAMIYRCRDLGVIDDDQFVNIYKQISARKWRKLEPLDDPKILPLEQPKLLRRSVELVLEANRKHPDEILADLNFSPFVISSFCNLQDGFFRGRAVDGDEVTLR